MSEGIGKRMLRLVEDNPPPCTYEDPELFFPPLTENDGNLQRAENAKAVCRKCPIIADCLQLAFETEDGWAVMGGSTPAERTLMARKREERAAKRARHVSRASLEVGLAA